MRPDYPLLLMFCIITATLYAQDEQPVTLHIGDQPPPLRMRAWLKGAPIKQFEKGHVYVLEFWATWCKPCKAAMPRLSATAEKYRGKVTIIGVDIYERESMSLEKLKTFVDSMGKRLDYHVAVEDSNFMLKSWLHASGEYGMPATMVVDQEGRLAWLGHPADLDKVLPQIVSNDWDVAKALAQRNTLKRLDSLDKNAYYELLRYSKDMKKPDAPEKTDSILWAINEMVKKEPRLKYAYSIAARTFEALLKTDPQKAYIYAKEALAAPAYNGPAYGAIVDVITIYSDKLNLSAEIYRLGAEARQAQIDGYAYPEILDLYKNYSKMADWHARAGNKPQAIAAMQKAIEILKSKEGFSSKDLAAYESRLQQYKNR